VRRAHKEIVQSGNCEAENRKDQEKDQVGISGIELIIGVEEDIDTRWREKKVVIDAFLIQEILASVKHYLTH
jgi:hypothetical protein